ncbi:MAG: TfoX/Sxy family protein [Hyphomicrobiaceae bacterium]
MPDEDLKALLAEHLAPLGPVAIKRMFGGAGLFLDGLMLGLIDDGVLYLKADDTSRSTFEAEGMAPFSYMRKGERATLTSYWRAPERLLDEPDELLAWAREAWAAARRAQSARPPKRRRRDTKP